MNPSPGNGFRTSANPFVKVLSLIAAGVVLVGAFFIGAVILAVVLGVAVVAGVALALRVWWIKRKLDRARPPADAPAAGAQGTLIDAEYRVLEERNEQADPESREQRRGGGR
jgi:uncharacterized iron-regulated membrane protein